MKKNEFVIEEFKKVGLSNYYMQMFDKDCNVNQRIYLLLKFIGIDQSGYGFDYLFEALKHLVKNPENDLTLGEVYDIIKKRYGKTTGSIERAIRTAKEKAIESMNPSLKVLVFGTNMKEIKNANFICALVNFIKYDIC